MFKYKVTSEDYMTMAKYLMKEKRKSLAGILKLLLLTVGQIAIVVILTIKTPDAPAWSRWLLIIISALVAGLTLFQNFFLNIRAKMVLDQRARSDPKGTFWMEHRLSLNENILRVAYGDQKPEIDARQVTAVIHLDEITMIRMGWNVFEVIPGSVTDTPEWADFEKDLLQRKYEIAEAEVQDACDKVLEKAQFKAQVQIGEEELVDTLVRMKRLSYALFCGWTKRELIPLAVGLAVLIYAISLKDPLYIVLGAVAFLLFNTNFFLTFTPYYRKAVRSRLIAPREDGYLLAATPKYIYLFGRYQSYRYDRTALKKIVSARDKVYVYYANQQMVFVPADVAERLVAVLQGRGGLSEKAKMGS